MRTKVQKMIRTEIEIETDFLTTHVVTRLRFNHRIYVNIEYKLQTKQEYSTNTTTLTLTSITYELLSVSVGRSTNYLSLSKYFEEVCRNKDYI